jgi:formylglycine-generating enzyme required for sulfatase activity
VGKKKPNPWGLYDMSGNVWEWTEDLYFGYEEIPSKKENTYRKRHVLRGGAWYFHPTYLRSSYRGTTIRGNFVGFRCVKDIPEKLQTIEI